MKTVRLLSPSLVIPATSAMWVLPLAFQIPGREKSSKPGWVEFLLLDITEFPGWAQCEIKITQAVILLSEGRRGEGG